MGLIQTLLKITCQGSWKWYLVIIGANSHEKLAKIVKYILWLVDVACTIRDSQWICLSHALLLFSDRSLNPIVHGWENNRSWLANTTPGHLRITCHATRTVQICTRKEICYELCYLDILKYWLIFCKIFDVLSSKLYGDHVDHCTLTHSRSVVCYLLSIAILIDLSWFNLLQKYRCLSVQFIFHHNYNYKMGGNCRIN